MSTQQQQRQAPVNGRVQQPSALAKSETPILDAILDAKVTYKPFMSDDEVSLTPRMVIQFFARPTKSGQRCTYDQAAKFVRLCQSRALNPWEGDAFIVGYDTKDGPEFNLVTAHQAFLKRAEVHPEYDGMESGVTVVAPGGIIEDMEGDLVPDGHQLIGGWCRVHFKNRSRPMYKRLKLATFNRNISRWNVDPAGMIVKCAEADGLRSSFPTRLGGMYLNEEFDAVEKASTKTPIPMPQAMLTALPAPTPTPVGQSEQRPDPEPEPTKTEPAEVVNEETGEVSEPSAWDDVAADIENQLKRADDRGYLDKVWADNQKPLLELQAKSEAHYRQLVSLRDELRRKFTTKK